jgi:hypothetical protein
MPVTGASLAALAAGSVLIWSAVTGQTVLAVVKDVIKGEGPGQVPAGVQDAAPVPAGASGGSVAPVGGSVGGNDAVNQALGRSMAALYGWGSGAEWTALNDVVMEESGWNDEAANPTSDARGIAQNINGWGPGYEAGNAPQQIAWLLSYIKQRYGDPIAAQQFHLANGWY